MPTKPALHDSLTVVATQGLSNVEFETVEAVALGVWYAEDTPAFSTLQGAHLGDAVLLVERLAYYNVVPQERKRELLALVRAVVHPPPQSTRDCFDVAFKRFLPKLQPLQTRHYLN